MARPDAEEEIWLGRGNRIEWVVLDGDDPVTDLSSTLKIVICVGDVDVDSSEVGPEVIWWTDSVLNKELKDGSTFTGDVVRAKLGLVPEIEAGEYENCRLVLFNPEYINGVVISDNINITVYEECGD